MLNAVVSLVQLTQHCIICVVNTAWVHAVQCSVMCWYTTWLLCDWRVGCLMSSLGQMDVERHSWLNHQHASSYVSCKMTHWNLELWTLLLLMNFLNFQSHRQCQVQYCKTDNGGWKSDLKPFMTDLCYLTKFSSAREGAPYISAT